MSDFSNNKLNGIFHSFNPDLSVFNKCAASGEALSRQISMSLIDTPQSLTGYKEFFRQNSSREDGWIESKIGDKGEWIRRWFIFDDGVLKYGGNSLDSDNELTKIPMDRVMSLRADTMSGDTTIVINTADYKLFLKLPNADEMKRWLFCFQKSVAMVLAHLITSSEPVYDDRAAWLREASVSSGVHRGSNSDKKRYSFAESKTVRRFGDSVPYVNRSFTMEDVARSHGGEGGFGKQMERGVFATESSNRITSTINKSAYQQIPAPVKLPSTAPASSSFASSAILAMSPAIPIGRALAESENSNYTEKLATSYKDPDMDSGHHIIDHILKRSVSQDTSQSSDMGGISPRASEDHYSENDGDDGDMQFDFEEVPTSRGGGLGGRSRSRSRSQTSNPGSPNLGGRKSSRSTTNMSPRSSVSSMGLSLNSVSSITAAAVQFSSSSGGHRYLQWRSGHHSKIGPKKTNEDTFVSLPYINDRLSDAIDVDFHMLQRQLNHSSGGGVEGAGAYFAVFDGHSGSQAASYLQEHLLNSICGHPSFRTDLVQAISETCKDTDIDVLSYCRAERLRCGTTALGAFIIASQLVVFNIGDCQAVLFSKGVAVEMSDSHKANRPDEMERIAQANGWVSEEKDLYLDRLHRMDLNNPAIRDRAKQLNWVTIHRVIGDIAVSRSIGDPDYKGFVAGKIVDECLAWPAGHSRCFTGDLLIPDPEFKSRELTKDDEFLILASDGLWDVVSPQEACLQVKHALASKKTTAEAAEELCTLALNLGSADNVTVIVVQFVHS